MFNDVVESHDSIFRCQTQNYDSRSTPTSAQLPFVKINNYVDIHVSVHVNYLKNINTNKQTFECILVLNFNWKEMRSSEKSDWIPLIAFENATNNVEIYHSNTKRITKGQHVTCVHTMIVNGVFYEHLELRQFPVDAQRLHIIINLMNCPIIKQQRPPLTPTNMVSPTSINRFRLINDYVVLDHDTFMDFDSWKIIEDVKLLRTKTNPVLNPDNISFCKCIVYLTVQRRPAYYFWNIIFPLSLEVALAHATVFVGNAEIGMKSQLTLTIILTIFAVKFSCNQMLPVVNSMTYLDMYFIYCTFYVCLITFQNLVVDFLQSSDNIDNINLITGTILGSIWFLSHVFIYTLFFSANVRKYLIYLNVEEEDELVHNTLDNQISGLTDSRKGEDITRYSHEPRDLDHYDHHESQQYRQTNTNLYRAYRSAAMSKNFQMNNNIEFPDLTTTKSLPVPS